MKTILLFLFPALVLGQVNQVGNNVAPSSVSAPPTQTTNNVIFAGGSSVTDNGSGQITVAAAGTNQDVDLVPSGTGGVFFTASPGTKYGLVNLPSSTSATAGVAWGADAALYRSAAGVMVYAGTGNGLWQMVGSGSGGGGFEFKLGNASANTASIIQYLSSNSATNWQIGSNVTVGGALEFTPSTAGGGSTFSTPSLYCTTTGIVATGITMGSGTGSVSATSGVFSVSSDIRVKNPHGDFTRGLDAIQGLKPALYDFKADKHHLTRAGFYTQNVAPAIPEAVFHDSPDGMASLDDRPITAALVNAVQELARRPGTLEIRLFEAIALLGLLLAGRAQRNR